MPAAYNNVYMSFGGRVENLREVGCVVLDHSLLGLSQGFRHLKGPQNQFFQAALARDSSFSSQGLSMVAGIMGPVSPEWITRRARGASKRERTVDFQNQMNQNSEVTRPHCCCMLLAHMLAPVPNGRGTALGIKKTMLIVTYLREWPPQLQLWPCSMPIATWLFFPH